MLILKRVLYAGICMLFFQCVLAEAQSSWNYFKKEEVGIKDINPYAKLQNNYEGLWMTYKYSTHFIDSLESVYYRDSTRYVSPESRDALSFPDKKELSNQSEESFDLFDRKGIRRNNKVDDYKYSYKDKNGTIWATNSSISFNYYSPSAHVNNIYINEKDEWHPIGEETDFKYKKFWVFYVDAKDNIWIVNCNTYLKYCFYHYDHSNWTEYYSKDIGLPTFFDLEAIHSDSLGNVFFKFKNDYYVFVEGEFKTLFKEDGKSPKQNEIYKWIKHNDGYAALTKNKSNETRIYYLSGMEWEYLELGVFKKKLNLLGDRFDASFDKIFGGAKYDYWLFNDDYFVHVKDDTIDKYETNKQDQVTFGTKIRNHTITEGYEFFFFNNGAVGILHKETDAFNSQMLHYGIGSFDGDFETFEDSQKNVWFFNEGRLFRFNGKRFTDYTSRVEMGSEYMLGFINSSMKEKYISINQHKNGDIYFAGYKIFIRDISVPVNDLLNFGFIAEYHDEISFLYKIAGNPVSIVDMSEEIKFPDQRILSIFIDDKGDLWLDSPTWIYQLRED